MLVLVRGTPREGGDPVHPPRWRPSSEPPPPCPRLWLRTDAATCLTFASHHPPLDLGSRRIPPVARWHAAPLPRKEVIQPQLPLRLPCYDFVPITRPTLGRCLLAVGPRTSSVTSFHDVTGGVYKAREHIHRTVLTCGY